ncbi:MAG: D-alanyl-D-alanine dipeptidase [Alphaproteobacteria bacterium]|nr:D-alanyl-D-alanine dipeptidase [Alphaproteobacteria bacterium]
MVSLVEITPASHDVRIELKYATADNFTGKPVYRADARCYLHRAAAEMLQTAVTLAKTQGYRFIIYDAFRPTEAQWKLWAHTPDPHFLADPAKGSPHSRGVAVDLVLCRWDFTPLDMGTAFDAFHPRSHHGNLEIHAQAQRNRLLLMGIMTSAGWDFYRNEWWHYQLFNARALYPLYADADAPAPVMA